MLLKEVAPVHVHMPKLGILPDYNSELRFVLIELTDGEGGKRTILRTDDPLGVGKLGDFVGHSKAYEFAKRSLPFEGKPLGGGSLLIVENKKLLELSGYSSTFKREPEREVTRKLLEEAYPDWKVSVVS